MPRGSCFKRCAVYGYTLTALERYFVCRRCAVGGRYSLSSHKECDRFAALDFFSDRGGYQNRTLRRRRFRKDLAEKPSENMLFDLLIEPLREKNNSIPEKRPHRCASSTPSLPSAPFHPRVLVRRDNLLCFILLGRCLRLELDVGTRLV